VSELQNEFQLGLLLVLLLCLGLWLSSDTWNSFWSYSEVVLEFQHSELQYECRHSELEPQRRYKSRNAVTHFIPNTLNPGEDNLNSTCPSPRPQMTANDRRPPPPPRLRTLAWPTTAGHFNLVKGEAVRSITKRRQKTMKDDERQRKRARAERARQ